jgi:hydroxypyruvate reductase
MPLEGLVVTRYEYAVRCECIQIVEAAHPMPDAAGHQATRRIKRNMCDEIQGNLFAPALEVDALGALPAEGRALPAHLLRTLPACGGAVALVDYTKRNSRKSIELLRRAQKGSQI